MSITKTKVGDPIFFGPGQTAIEYSITFDTNYATTGGEILGFGSTTNFPNDVKRMIVTKPFSGSVGHFVAQLVPSTDAGSACIQLFRLMCSTTNSSFAVLVEMTNTVDLTGVSGRALIFGV